MPRMVLKITNLHILRYLPTCWLYLLERYTIDNQRCTHTRNGKFNCTNVCGLLKLKKGFDAHFVSLVLAEATRMYVSTNLANPKLMNNTMGNIQIRLPKLEEQKRISVVFRKLHGLLETHNSLIIKYSKQKQYLLSQMFI